MDVSLERGHQSLRMSAMRSPMITQGARVRPVTLGMIEPPAMRRFFTP